MIAFIKNKIQKKDKGFTLLFAVLVSTLVVSISATVISIALRQTIISGTSRESQYAFYAANTIVECLLYWDLIAPNNSTIGVVFPAPGESQNPSFNTIQDEITCAGGSIVTGKDFTGNTTNFADSGWNRNPVINETEVFIEIRDTVGLENKNNEMFSHEYCAKATITKEKDATTSAITTTISAKGYNTCDLSNPRTVERGLVQQY